MGMVASEQARAEEEDKEWSQITATVICAHLMLNRKQICHVIELFVSVFLPLNKILIRLGAQRARALLFN